MRHVFANRVRLCVFHLLFLLAGVSVAPFVSAQIDPGDTYCSNHMYGLSKNDFEVKFTISLNSYNAGWEPPAYAYHNVGSYKCELMFRTIALAAGYENTGTVEVYVSYSLTGRKYRGSNPSGLNDYIGDSSLNPSNPFLYSNGTFDRGMNCTEGQHGYTPFPKGYRYVPFDGFKYLSNDSWSACLNDIVYEVLLDIFWENDWHSFEIDFIS